MIHLRAQKKNVCRVFSKLDVPELIHLGGIHAISYTASGHDYTLLSKYTQPLDVIQIISNRQPGPHPTSPSSPA